MKTSTAPGVSDSQSARRFDALTLLSMSVAGLYFIVFIASFIQPPLMLVIFLGLLVVTIGTWSVYFYVTAFREGFWIGMRVLIIPFYEYVYWTRTTDRMIRAGLWVWVFGLILFTATGAYHLASDAAWERERERFTEPRPYTPRNKQQMEANTAPEQTRRESSD